MDDTKKTLYQYKETIRIKTNLLVMMQNTCKTNSLMHRVLASHLLTVTFSQGYQDVFAVAICQQTCYKLIAKTSFLYTGLLQVLSASCNKRLHLLSTSKVQTQALNALPA